MSAAQSLRGVSYRDGGFFLGSLKLVQSPAEAQRIDTPRDQWLLLVSQQDMVESMLNDLRWECCHLCVITTFMPTVCQCWDIPVSDSSSSPPLLSCHELASPTVLGDRECLGMSEVSLRSLQPHFSSPKSPLKGMEKRKQNESKWEQEGCQAYRHKE